MAQRAAARGYERGACRHDLLGLHRDLSGYYRQFGFLDTSTTQALAERVIYPHCVGPPAAPPRERQDAGRQRQGP